jgi:hypothetical protein
MPSKIIFFVFLSFIVGQVNAGPPQDFFGAPEQAAPKKRELTENDLVYTDTAQNSESDLAPKAKIKVNKVAARSLPGRKGKVLFVLEQNETVSLLKKSKDQQWWAVYSFKFNKKGWVPVTSLEKSI